MNQRFTNIWDAIEDTPEEAENMKLRSTLMMSLNDYIDNAKMNPTQAARLFGVTQPRIFDLIQGKINLFSLDSLVNMATSAGLHVEIKITEAIHSI